MAGRVIVVGAGVVGLTCAVRLLEAGHRVDVIARDLPLETTSAVAAALWYPYRALPQDRVLAWSRTSYAVFDALADTDPGVRGRGCCRAPRCCAQRQPEPWWRAAVPGLESPGRAARVDRRLDLHHAGRGHAVYLSWLAGRVDALGGTITRLNLGALPAGADWS